MIFLNYFILVEEQVVPKTPGHLRKIANRKQKKTWIIHQENVLKRHYWHVNKSPSQSLCLKEINLFKGNDIFA